jgi:hypothetical protein
VDVALATDEAVEQLKERLDSLKGNCLRALEKGLAGMVKGDLTLRGVLGDQSCLDDLRIRLHSLHDNDLSRFTLA